ncbi:MAG: translation initiation factor eIF-2B [Candidatus Nanoarchaeia archaeon]|nr:translation initiation factor eIF-2B [Candidatus Nanoarchaeia archaeon]MDD5358174.1 translation initiation factor eIF-2B [Candidatus Nanoarchaeia archaeon]MDD5589440.1 translation initiation factor eIF-2B [Candidatus Nanoarchaeia archaeon]
MNRKRFDKIAGDIKKIKIQGARNIAKSALLAYSLVPTKSSIKKLKSLRPTEPMLEKVLNLVEKKPYKEILEHFNSAQNKINLSVLKLIKNGDVIFTHCHSTNVSNALIYAKKKGKKFQVYNTETRPLFQGRKTANELRKAGIKVTMFVDSAVALAIEKENRKDKIYADKIFLGADALLPNGIINKIGSGLIAELAHAHKIPFYIVADSWKFTKKKVPIEQRSLNEVWNNAPRNVKIKNPAFEFVPKKYISGIVTEFGIMKYDKFVGRME